MSSRPTSNGMQCVILAAGRGERMGSLTDGAPKALLEVSNKTLIEHKLDALPEQVDEVVIVVGYMGGAIQKYLGGFYNDKRIFYIEQEKSNGTAGALWCASSVLRDSFLVMNADDIYAKEDIVHAAESTGWSVVALKVDALGSAAKIIVDKHGRVKDILESDEHKGGTGFLNTGLYCLDTKVFDVSMVPKSPGSPEFGLPQTLVKADIPLKLIQATFWLSITTPEDLEKAEEILNNRRD